MSDLPRMGLLGGTFDPPHRGHLKIAHAAIEALQLDGVIFLPAARNPMKRDRATVSGEHRLEMVRLLIQDDPRLAVSDMELTRGGVSYTVDTIGELQMVQPAEYWFLMGSDMLANFPEWRNPQRILRLCRIGVVPRPPLTALDVEARVPLEFHERFDVLPMAPEETSSTEVRNAIRTGRLRPDAVPRPVLEYIKKHRLYPAA
ncbi:MAG: nicotinate (nicotinamide) nucleotide adenylyltransferase [Chloroflexota bacterium]